MRKDILLCFEDYENMFVKAQHDKLRDILKSVRDTRCIKNLYWRQTAGKRGHNVKTNYIVINIGVQQRRISFSLLSEIILQEAIETIEAGINVNGQRINNTLQDLQTMLQTVNDQSNNFGLK